MRAQDDHCPSSSYTSSDNRAQSSAPMYGCRCHMWCFCYCCCCCCCCCYCRCYCRCYCCCCCCLHLLTIALTSVHARILMLIMHAFTHSPHSRPNRREAVMSAVPPPHQALVVVCYVRSPSQPQFGTTATTTTTTTTILAVEAASSTTRPSSTYHINDSIDINSANAEQHPYFILVWCGVVWCGVVIRRETQWRHG